VPIFSFSTQGDKQAIPFFDRGTGSKPERLKLGSLPTDLSACLL